MDQNERGTIKDIVKVLYPPEVTGARQGASQGISKYLLKRNPNSSKASRILILAGDERRNLLSAPVVSML